MSDDIVLKKVITQKCGTIQVFVQGNLDDRVGKTVFLTVHDVGTNHKSIVDYVNRPSMAEVKSKSVFLHVCIPGQEDHAPDHLGEYPTLNDLSEDMVCILDALQVRTVIVFGEGAGANVVCRFAIVHPNRILGVILVRCTSTTAGVVEYIKDKYINMRLESGGMSNTAWEYLIFHKFGSQAEKKDFIKDYMGDVQSRLNQKNLARYLSSFVKRTDISAQLTKDLRTDSLLVVGSKASHVHTVHTMHQNMNPEKTTLLVVDGVGDVMYEAPQKLARALVLFCKGCGVLSGVAIPGMERQRTLSSSMEEADRPRRLSTTNPPSQAALQQSLQY